MAAFDQNVAQSTDLDALVRRLVGPILEQCGARQHRWGLVGVGHIAADDNMVTSAALLF